MIKTMDMIENRKDNEEKEDPYKLIAESILYEMWYSIAEKIFERVCEITELDEEQRDALRKVALRPNDFQIKIE
jgi:hypothetical protein